MLLKFLHRIFIEILEDALRVFGLGERFKMTVDGCLGCGVGWLDPELQNWVFYPNLPIFLHGYIRHIHDILQLWLDHGGEHLLDNKLVKLGDAIAISNLKLSMTH